METNEGEHLSQQPTVNVKAETEKDVPSGHTCGVCGRSFPLLSSLSQHMRSHTQEKPYKCPHCEHRTAQKGSLKAHIRSHKLGLFTQNLCDKDGDQEKNKAPEIPDSLVTGSDKTVPVNGKVKRKRSKEKAKDSNVMENSGETEGSSICSICGQVFPQALLLKSHMKTHCGSQDYGCRICGRRFRQAWFLQSHMRVHQVKEQLKGDSEPPATINGVPQDPASLRNEVCLYELCGICGNFFPDLNVLQTHEKLHKVNHNYAETQPTPQGDTKASDMQTAMIRFMAAFNLKPVAPKEVEEKKLSERISQLDPITSYQALQLATRGRLVTSNASALKYLGRVKEKKKRVPVKKEKRKRTKTPGPKNKKVKRDTDLHQTSKGTAQPKGGGEKNCQKSDIPLNGLGHAFYEELQSKKLKDTQTSSVNSKYQEGNMPYFCEYCDFRTVTIALLRSHLNDQHPEFLDVSSLLSGNKAVMDYLIRRNILLSQHSGNPSTSTPGHGPAESNTETEKSNGTDVKGQGDTSFTGTILDLSTLAIIRRDSTVKTEDLVKHQCPYCSHASYYPEVLWMHQRVAHKVECSSSVAPKWAPCTYSPKSSKAGTGPVRRTGPPLFLEGKDCPPLPAPRSQRTQPPDIPGHSSSKHVTRLQSGALKRKYLSKDRCSSYETQSSGKRGQSQKKSEHKRQRVEGGSEISTDQTSSSSSMLSGNSASSFQPVTIPKHHSAPTEVNFPKEGLGFMLARNHSKTAPSLPVDRSNTRRHSCDSSLGPKGPNRWSALNMWGRRAYSDPLHYAQGKSESTGEMPMDIDVLGLSRGYIPQDLACLYQHWGFVTPRTDPQALSQLSGDFGKETHSTSESSKQVNSCATSSSGTLHKAM